MSQLFAPLLVQFALTACLLLATGWLRTKAVRTRQVRIGDIALGQNAWPPRVAQVANAFHNQLEMPIFFMVVILLAAMRHDASTLTVGLAWGYVALRLGHAAVHVTSNRVPVRFAIFAASNAVLMALWLRTAIMLWA